MTNFRVLWMAGMNLQQVETFITGYRQDFPSESRIYI